MNKTEIVNRMSRGLNRAGMKIKKHSPELLMVAGITGTVVSAVMACKATLKVNDILEDSKKQIDTIHEVLDCTDLEGKYTEEDSKKDLAIVYTQTGLKLAKLYGPSILLGITSIGCILASNNIIRKRNAALAIAYNTVDKSFKEYRNRVIERFGEELDRELRYDIRAKEVEEIVIDEDGNETIVTKTVEVANPNNICMWTKCFDETCKNWERDAELNHYFLRQVQQWADEKLHRQGHLTLNEVYEKLGLPKTKDGAVVGWVYNEEHPVGDNFVDFGIYELHDENKRAFVNGYEKSIWLNFNVDGYIWDLI